MGCEIAPEELVLEGAVCTLNGTKSEPQDLVAKFKILPKFMLFKPMKFRPVGTQDDGSSFVSSELEDAVAARFERIEAEPVCISREAVMALLGPPFTDERPTRAGTKEEVDATYRRLADFFLEVKTLSRDKKKLVLQIDNVFSEAMEHELLRGLLLKNMEECDPVMQAILSSTALRFRDFLANLKAKMRPTAREWERTGPQFLLRSLRLMEKYSGPESASNLVDYLHKKMKETLMEGCDLAEFLQGSSLAVSVEGRRKMTTSINPNSWVGTGCSEGFDVREPYFSCIEMSGKVEVSLRR